MNEIKVIVFDLGNVLIPFDYNKLKAKLDTIDDGLGLRFAQRYFENYEVHKDYEKSKMSYEEFIAKMMEWTENKIDEELFCEYYSDLFEENTELTKLLPELKKKFRLVLLSNTNFVHRKYGWDKYSFLQNFENLILSYEVEANKPEQEIYKAVEDYTKQHPEEHIFIDDIEDYINAAKSRGWDGIQFLGNDDLFAKLKTKGIL